MDASTIVGGVILLLLILLIIIIKNRNVWSPVKNVKLTPRISKSGKCYPATPKMGRPIVIPGDIIGKYVSEEVNDFYEFLCNVRGSIKTEEKRIPVNKSSGRLLSWSYRPFREGNWLDMVCYGLKQPDFPYFFGSPSLIPNPSGNEPESPLTLVTSEEDILRCVGGSIIVRLFHPNQPTFPKFLKDEHGDFICKKTRQKIKGEEFIIEAGDLLIIPRGWGYRVRLDTECISLFRIPVHGLLSSIQQIL